MNGCGVALSAAQVQAAVLESCAIDIEALKPGNVSRSRAGHGMTDREFELSAAVAAPLLATPGQRVGGRILAAVRASVERVGCNTNLGIVLLSAPLCQAALWSSEGPLRERLRTILTSLDVADARLAFEAIRLAEPAGLGQASEHDVYDEPRVSLSCAMQAASAWDAIAREFSTDFQVVFDVGIPTLQKSLAVKGNLAGAATACFLRLASNFVDTHIQRKHGSACAQRVRDEMSAVEKAWKACENPASATSLLQDYDNKLKHSGINPGTSADLTVASLLALRLESHLIEAASSVRAQTQ